MNQQPRLFSFAFSLTTIVVRLVPHPPHVSSVAALALFVGCYLSFWQGATPTLLGNLFFSASFFGLYLATIAFVDARSRFETERTTVEVKKS